MKKIRGIFEKNPGSKIWWVQYWDSEGRRRREKVGTRSAAIQLYHKRKTEALEGKKLPEKLRSKSLTFAQLAIEALEYSKATKISWEDDVYRMKPLIAAFGARGAETIKPQDIERWFQTQGHLKPASLNRYRALLSLIYRLALENGKVSVNPARLVRQRKENNARIRFLDWSEEEALRAVISDKYAHHLPEFDLALNTGLRLSEQYGLTWDNIDFERRVLTVPRSKNGEVRRVPLNDAAVVALRAAQRLCAGQSCVFLNRYGDRLTKPREWFVPCVHEAGIRNFTWHCIRHTFASRLVMAGVNLRTVQELMGHKTIQMTVRYAHLTPEHQLAAVQRLCDTGTAQAHTSATATTTATSDSVERSSLQLKIN